MITIDTSTPAFTTLGISATSATTGSFSPPADSVIYLFMSVHSAANASQSITSVTDNQTVHLTWAQLAADNIVSASVGDGAFIWWAYCPMAITGLTVTANFGANTSSSGTGGGLLQPVVFKNAASNQASANKIVRNNLTGATPSMSLSTTFTGSWVFGVIANWSNSTSPTVGASQTNTINGNSGVFSNATSGDSYWVQLQNAPTATGLVTISDSAPTLIIHHFAMVEIVPKQLLGSRNLRPAIFKPGLAR